MGEENHSSDRLKGKDPYFNFEIGDSRNRVRFLAPKKRVSTRRYSDPGEPKVGFSKETCDNLNQTEVSGGKSSKRADTESESNSELKTSRGASSRVRVKKTDTVLGKVTEKLKAERLRKEAQQREEEARLLKESALRREQLREEARLREEERDRIVHEEKEKITQGEKRLRLLLQKDEEIQVKEELFHSPEPTTPPPKNPSPPRVPSPPLRTPPRMPSPSRIPTPPSRPITPTRATAPQPRAPTAPPAFIMTTMIPLPMTLTPLDCEKDFVADWLETFDKYSAGVGWDDAKKIGFLPLFLGSVAKQWHKNYCSNNPSDSKKYPETRKALLDAFSRDGKDKMKAKAKLRNRKQGDTESVDAYVYSCLELIDRIDTAMSETEKVKKIIRGYNLT
jgi:hypothetical protein